MSKYKITKQKPQKEDEPLSVFFGKIWIVCGALFLLMLAIIYLSGVPTNLDGTTAKLVITICWIIFGLLWVGVGIYCVVKKPLIKVDGFTARAMIKEIEADQKKEGKLLSKEEKQDLYHVFKGTKI